MGGADSPLLKETRIAGKTFLVRAEGGRGVPVTLPLAEVLGRWDHTCSNDPEDEFEPSLGEWLEVADVGDAFFHRDDVPFTRANRRGGAANSLLSF